ncbi:carbamoyltransferase HypF [Hydrogenimonas sp.]
MKIKKEWTHRYIVVTGVVQGVGFRPFVYRVAKKFGLKGHVCNTSSGVKIHIEGLRGAVETFLKYLETDAPPLAKIDSIAVEAQPLHGFADFEIVTSDDASEKSTSVSPDVSVCEMCLQEMHDPSNRRYRYPFINCTDCGPRYTITTTVPYDRPNTSMAKFEMCPACAEEYENKMDRRYHAQPISCFDCGPTLSLLDGAGQAVDCSDPLAACAERLKKGAIVAVKGLGGFHLMCDATNNEAVQRLRERKRRPIKPFAVMVKDLEMAKTLAEISDAEEALLVSRERPIVLLKKSTHYTLHTTHLSGVVVPRIDRIGIMLPYTPLHELLFDMIDRPLVATSANLSDEPIIRASVVLVEKLGHIVDAILDHDRDIINACDDSVMQVVGGQPLWLRVARGIAPLTLPLKKPTRRKILAVGANQKNTIALAFADRIIVSPHIGDLNGIEAMEYFDRTVETFKRFYDFTPDIIAHDKHPGYETTKWTHQFKIQHPTCKIISVQHHYAHALAVMAEHGLRNEKVLAFCWDGTGYGDDGTIWGSEVLHADASECRRVVSLRPFRLLGGEKAIKEPRRVALELLFECFTLDEVLALENPTVDAFRPAEIRLLHQAWEKGINAPVTTSMGRLFDAVASLCGICQYLGFEGESGMRIEALARNVDAKPYPLPLEGGRLEWSHMIHEIAHMPDTKVVASRFIATLVEMVFAVASRMPDMPLLFAGGVFQNRTLVEHIVARCEAEGRTFYLPKKLSPNDGAVSLGQLWYALGQE